MDLSWSETCWNNFKYFIIILIASTNYIFVYLLDNKVFNVPVSLRTPRCIQYIPSYFACNLNTFRTSLATDRHAPTRIRILGQCNALPYLNHAASCGQVLFYVSWWYCINLAAPFSEITLFVSYTTKLPATFLLMFIDSADNVHRYMTWFLFSILIFDPEGTLLYL